MILECDIAAVRCIHKNKSLRPCSLAELTALQAFCPLGSKDIILHNLLAILVMLHMPLVHNNAAAVPFPPRLGILRIGRYHVIKRS